MRRHKDEASRDASVRTAVGGPDPRQHCHWHGEGLFAEGRNRWMARRTTTSGGVRLFAGASRAHRRGAVIVVMGSFIHGSVQANQPTRHRVRSAGCFR